MPAAHNQHSDLPQSNLREGLGGCCNNNLTVFVPRLNLILFIFASPLANPTPGWGICLPQTFAGSYHVLPTSSLPNRAMHIYPWNHLSPPKTFVNSFPLVIILVRVWQSGAGRILSSAWISPALIRR